MPPLVRYILNRVLSVPVTLLIITAVLYGTIMLTPPEVRASLYLPKKLRAGLTEKQLQNLTEQIVKRYRLRDPFPVQYGIWLSNLARGNWGYSPTLQMDVLPALVRRTPITAELTLYSLLAFIPLGLVSGVISGWKQNSRADLGFRLAAFTATSLPPFILALVLLSIFYVAVYWFPPDRLSILNGLLVQSKDWHSFTGLITIDGLLNGRLDVSLDALRHLVLPVFTLSLLHWATLGRITRAAMIEALQKEYVIAARARGISARALIWRHAFRNALTPALASSALSAASLITGVFVVEVIFNFKGISDIIIGGLRNAPDAPAALGFCIYSVTVVMLLMLVLDIIQAIFDPRTREGVITP